MVGWQAMEMVNYGMGWQAMEMVNCGRKVSYGDG